MIPNEYLANLKKVLGVERPKFYICGVFYGLRCAGKSGGEGIVSKLFIDQRRQLKSPNRPFN